MLAKCLPTLAALIALVPAAVAAWLKLSEVLRPLLARRRLRVAVVSLPEDKDAAALVESLRRSGYRDAWLTHAPGAGGVTGAGAVVLHTLPPATAGAVLADVQAAAPLATVLVLTYERLEVKLGARVLLANSPVRLRGDLAAIAEAVG